MISFIKYNDKKIKNYIHFNYHLLFQTQRQKGFKTYSKDLSDFYSRE